MKFKTVAFEIRFELRIPEGASPTDVLSTMTNAAIGEACKTLGIHSGSFDATSARLQATENSTAKVVSGLPFDLFVPVEEIKLAPSQIRDFEASITTAYHARAPMLASEDGKALFRLDISIAFHRATLRDLRELAKLVGWKGVGNLSRMKTLEVIADMVLQRHKNGGVLV